MAELSLRERLQPALLDRLIDDERLLTLFEIRMTRQTLQRLALSERDFTSILAAQGLRTEDERQAAPHEAGEAVLWRMLAPAGRVRLSQLKSLRISPPGAPAGVALESICHIEAHNVPNTTAEPAERRHISTRRLREYVCRDLAALLNSMNLEQEVDLERYPHVQRSVLNFGMPSLAGRGVTSIDPLLTAATIEAVISRFEPRLTRVRVIPDEREGGADAHRLSFRIEARLWGQPTPQNLVLRTRIDTESGDVSVADTGAAA